MKQYTDPISRLTYKFKEEEVISVYLRRSNGKKRLVFSSRSPQKSFTFYHSVKTFMMERKYLTAKVDGFEIELMAESGTDRKPLSPRRGVKAETNYHYATIPGIPKVPKTMNDALMKLLNAQRVPNSMDKITRNRLIPMLLSYYVSLSQEERDKLNTKSDEEYIKQKMKSGGNMTAKYSKMMELNDVENDDLL